MNSASSWWIASAGLASLGAGGFAAFFGAFLAILVAFFLAMGVHLLVEGRWERRGPRGALSSSRDSRSPWRSCQAHIGLVAGRAQPGLRVLPSIQSSCEPRARASDPRGGLLPMMQSARSFGIIVPSL